MNRAGIRAGRPTAVFVLVAIRLYRDGLARFIDGSADFLLSGASGDIPASLARIDEVQPDAVTVSYGVTRMSTGDLN